MNSDVIDEKPMYGIWIPAQGWLKNDKGIYANFSIAIAKQVARRIGRGAKVYFVDNAIQDLEQVLLLAERDNTLLARLRKLTR